MRGLILFDIDGTLLKVGDRHHSAAFMEAMSEVYGLNVTLDGVPLAGMLDSQIARLALSRHGLSHEEIDRRLAEMIALMGERYTTAIAAQTGIERLLPGVVEIVSRLQDETYALGVLTGNAQAVARAKLSATGLLDYFSVGAFGDSATERGHLVQEAWHAAEVQYQINFDARQTVLVGDTPRDIEAARFAGAHALAVATGRFSVDELATHEPDALLPDLSDTEAAVDAIERLVSTK